VVPIHGRGGVHDQEVAVKGLPMDVAENWQLRGERLRVPRLWTEHISATFGQPHDDPIQRSPLHVSDMVTNECRRRGVPSVFDDSNRRDLFIRGRSRARDGNAYGE